MPSLLPISVVLPTRDSMDKLPRHLTHHLSLYARCAEIIHCDSHSKDETKSHLASILGTDARLRQLDHPPGLYESWNFAIQQCTQPFIYFSTVGDEMDPDGMQKLLDLAVQTEADVVISPPRFIEENGEKNEGLLWPIHHLIRTHGLKTAGVVSNDLLYAEAVLHAPDGILGSSHSCLYRTSFLKPRPFPLGFHGSCDAVWALRNLPSARCALLPTPVSTFLLHPKTYESHEELNIQIAVLVRKTISHDLRNALREAKNHSKSVINLPLPTLQILRRFNLLALLLARQEKLLVTSRKAMHGLWVLSPNAWNARKFRNRYRRIRPNLFAKVQEAISLLEV